MRLVIISDTHGDHLKLKLPAGDVLIHCGDFCTDTEESHWLSALRFVNWFGAQPHKHKVFIAGNHDVFLDSAFSARYPNESLMFLKVIPPNVYYLNDSGITLDGVKFWGSPVQPVFFNWAFNRTSSDIGKHWQMIPVGTNVLITHGPAYGYRDQAFKIGSNELEHTGCPQLLAKIEEIKPALHCYGHIHYSYGAHQAEDTLHINASNSNERYKIANKPMVVDLFEGIAVHVDY